MVLLSSKLRKIEWINCWLHIVWLCFLCRYLNFIWMHQWKESKAFFMNNDMSCRRRKKKIMPGDLFWDWKFKTLHSKIICLFTKRVRRALCFKLWKCQRNSDCTATRKGNFLDAFFFGQTELMDQSILVQGNYTA